MHGNESAAEGTKRKPSVPRGREAMAAHVRAIPLRVAVTGVDGTFELTRMVHEALAARRRRVFAQGGFDEEHPRAKLRLRQQRSRRLLRQVAKAGQLDALVLESPDVGEDGLEFNQEVAQAQALLLTGIARDPGHGALAPDPARAAAIAQSLPPLATLVSGEPDPKLKEALRVAVRDAGGFFIDAAPRVDRPAPGLELITVLDRFLRMRIGEGLTSAEKVRLLARMERRLQWSPSAFAGVRWHDGTCLPPTFLRSAIDHLVHRWPGRLHLLAYYGDGKARDAERMVPVLQRAFADGVLAHAYVAGPGSRPIVRALSSSQPISLFGPRASALPGLFRMLRRECHSGAVVTAGDGGAPWMRAAMEWLRLPDLGRGDWAPIGARASDLPAAIAAPKPAAPAPGIGRRSKANILGDLDPALLPPPKPRRGLLPEQGWQAPPATG